METSDQVDGKQRCVKVKKGRTWAKALLRPQTLKSALSVGILITRVLWLIYKIIAFFNK